MWYRCAHRKPCITVQPGKVGTKLSTNRSPLGKPIDVQDTACKSSGLVTQGFTWVVKLGRPQKRSYHLKPVQYAIVAINSWLGVKLRRCAQISMKRHQRNIL